MTWRMTRVTPPASPATDGTGPLIRQFGASALIAGLAAGVVAALLQIFALVPLILEAELYETGARVHFSEGSIQSIAEAPAIGGELSRHLGTLAINLVAWVGFALVLVAGFALAARSGHRVDARRGIVWGLAGFAALTLAPSFGLPPELPGTISAEMHSRQMWWIGCALSTAAGLALLGFGRGPAWLIGGVALLALPHLIGAPHLDTYFGASAPELAALFAARALGVSAVAWVVLGASAGWLWSREA